MTARLRTGFFNVVGHHTQPRFRRGLFGFRVPPNGPGAGRLVAVGHGPSLHGLFSGSLSTASRAYAQATAIRHRILLRIDIGECFAGLLNELDQRHAHLCLRTVGIVRCELA